jgi:hypothetical protein
MKGFLDEIALANMKLYKLSGFEQSAVDVIQAGCKTLCSQICDFIN